MRALTVLLLAALVACEQGERVPRSIVQGVDACEYCHMAVSNADRAAQFLPAKGEALIFDEPGCLASWLGKNGSAAGVAYVADEDGSGWLPADSAVFVKGAARTDMGFNVTAYRDSSAARTRVAAAGGTIITWSDVRKEVANGHSH